MLFSTIVLLDDVAVVEHDDFVPEGVAVPAQPDHHHTAAGRELAGRGGEGLAVVGVVVGVVGDGDGVDEVVGARRPLPQPSFRACSQPLGVVSVLRRRG